jgi:hypothetical protein
VDCFRSGDWVLRTRFYSQTNSGRRMEVEMIEALLWFIAVFLFFGVVAFTFSS